MGRILKLRGADSNWLEVPAIKGSTGATFTPNVSSEGVLSWVNDEGLKNPDPISV